MADNKKKDVLCYFPIRSRADPIQMIGHYVGYDYVYEDCKFEDWPAMKPKHLIVVYRF
eukprot:UN12148